MAERIAVLREEVDRETSRLVTLRSHMGRVTELMSEPTWITDRRDEMQAEIDHQTTIVEDLALDLQVTLREAYRELLGATERYTQTLDPSARAWLLFSEVERICQEAMEMDIGRVEGFERREE
jgi:hypothetical protein